ncbi:MAG: alpha/beta fold hydrolase [Patescibacteria group bacterium]|nr:alpha/beta fold hydrolase [Patescibacteria group bacterium]
MNPTNDSTPRQDDWRALYPFRSHEMDVGGFRYHYVDEGQGSPLLLVHGNPTWSFYWRELIRQLRDEYRLVAPDHLGCGLSQKPTTAEYPFTLARRVSDLCALIEGLDLRGITLVAHDWGGAIGLGAAVAMPERFARLVLLNTAAFPSNRCPWRIRVCRTPVLGRLAVQGLNLFARSATIMALHRRSRLSRAARAGLLAPYDSWRNRTAVYQFVHDIPLSRSHPSYATLAAIEAGLAQLRHLPTMLIWGMHDWCFTPHFLDRFREIFPAAEVVPMEDAGHYVVEEAPAAIVERLRPFLSQAQSCTNPE